MSVDRALFDLPDDSGRPVAGMGGPMVPTRSVVEDTAGGASDTLERVLASPRQVGGTDVEPELHGGAIHAPYWADRTGLEGMGLAVQRMKRVALEHCGGASFGEPVVRLIGGDEAHGPELTLVCLDIVLPEDVDRDQFRDGFFASIAEELSDDDSTRLAVNVIGEA